MTTTLAPVTATLRLICAWCKRVLREGDGVDAHASHGLCESCREKYFPDCATRIRP